MNETILTLAFATLPSKLLEDLFFQKLCSTVPLEIKLCDKIGISSSMYELLKKMDNRLTHYFKPLQNKDNYMTLTSTYQNQLLTILIKKENDTWLTTYNMKSKNIQKQLTFTKNPNTSKVKIITLTKMNGKITSYQNEVHYYSPTYEEQKSPLSIKETLADFSDLFGIPQEFALYFYQNFAKYQEELNRSKMMMELELDNQTRPAKEQYHFTVPIQFLDVIEEIIKCNQNDLFLKKRSSYIINLLAKEIDINEKIIMSQNLLENILKYIMGLTFDILLATGLVICKKEDDYEQSEITINNNNIHIKKERLKISQAQELFYRNENNENKEELEEFFGITKTR